MSIDFAPEHLDLGLEARSARLDPTPTQHDEDRSFLRLTRCPRPVCVDSAIEIVDLFSGLGGMTLGALEGARRAGRVARLALAADLETEPLRVLRETFGVDTTIARKVDLGSLLRPPGHRVLKREETLFENVVGPAVLLAGPPCQGHSTLNNYTRHDDPRNALYLAVARAVEVLRPTMVIVENVRGVGSDRRSAMRRCAVQLLSLGYEVVEKRVSLDQVGVPQRRVRHVMIASLERPFSWGIRPTQPRSVQWAIEDLLDVAPTRVSDTPTTPTAANRERMNWLFDEDQYDLPNRLRPICHRGDHTYKSMYGRLRWDAPAQTITSGFGSMGQGRYVHPLRRRTLTPHEAARLQFLPDFVALDVAATRRAMGDMIGNVAPPALTIALIQSAIEQALI